MRNVLLCALALAPLVAGCGSDSSPTDPGPAATTTFQGTVAGTGGQSGTLSVTVQAQVAANRPSFPQWPLVATLHGAPPDTSVVTGVFNLVVSDASGAVSGSFNIYADSPPTVGTISGQLTGTALTATGTAVSGRFAPGTVALTGTIQGGSVSGTSASSNPFSATASRCQS